MKIMQKKVLLTAVNAKYIHSNLAVHSLRASAKQAGYAVELEEFTINQQRDYILQEIYRKKPEILAFSCYIWNIETILQISANIRQILPETEIWLGGPEAFGGGTRLLEEQPQLRGIMEGEGEETFCLLLKHYQEGTPGLAQIPGICYRDEEGTIRTNARQCPAEYLPMDSLPFVYQDMEQFANRIIYYESSRGCPFSCSYCLSSLDKRVRFRSTELVERELQFFLDKRVPLVKFVDRTFNANCNHAMKIWKYILEHDNGETTFHFEIEADLLNQEELELLSRMRPGLVQLEIGVQSVNEKTLQAVHRRTDFSKIAHAAETIRKGKNIHQHLDLIAGLPYENMESFRNSFDQVYRLRPQELQLGFLKVLKGSAMYEDASRWGIRWHQEPPYEVLSTPWLSYGELLCLKGVEEMLEVYYNSQQFSHTIEALEECFDSPFSLYEALAAFYQEKGLGDSSFSRMQRLELLREFAGKTDPQRIRRYEECLLLDLYLREKAKMRPEWAPNPKEWKEEAYRFYREAARKLLPQEKDSGWKQIMGRTHLERFSMKNGAYRETWILFDYADRDPLSHNARYREVEIPPAEAAFTFS